MANSIKTNLVYNALNIVTGLLFPLITFPYASRTLMAEGLGHVQFYNSIISYVILLTGLGIPAYGIREIARVRDDIKELSKTTIELILLELMLNIVGYIVVFVMCFTIDKIQADIPLFLLLSTSIILTTIGCSWFFSGIEEFKYITIRGIIVRLISIAFLFTFVKDKNDIFYYGIYTVIGTVGNNVWNFIKLRKFIDVKAVSLSELSLFRHLRPAISLFMLSIITSIYLNLDKVMLGFLKDSASVGYYTSATTISHMVLSFVTSFGTVLLPRSSNLIKNERWQDFNQLVNKSCGVVSILIFPLCLGMIVLAAPLIHLLCGETYEEAILTLQLIAPVIICIGLSNLIGMQILYPMGKYRSMTICATIGAIINLILNLILIPIYSQNGAAISTVIAELSVTISQCVIVRRVLGMRIFTSDILKYIFASLIMLVACIFLKKYLASDLVQLLLITTAGVIIYGGILFCMKDSNMFYILNSLKLKKNTQVSQVNNF